MSPRTWLLTSLLSLLLATSLADDHTLSAYEVLESYDFPVGLLPKGVLGYELNPETGDFKLYLEQTCKFHIDSYELEYKSTITGKISPDRITNLKGVKVKVLFLWLSIVEIDKTDDELEFSVGIASARFPLEGFDESPSCGCGFDCVGARLGCDEEQKMEAGKMVAAS